MKINLNETGAEAKWNFIKSIDLMEKKGFDRHESEAFMGLFFHIRAGAEIWHRYLTESQLGQWSFDGKHYWVSK
ncbi:MAG: hypothetical protein ACFFCW_01860 [Candidatus Hodarchaeota archaeon]